MPRRKKKKQNPTRSLVTQFSADARAEFLRNRRALLPLQQLARQAPVLRREIDRVGGLPLLLTREGVELERERATNDLLNLQTSIGLNQFVEL